MSKIWIRQKIILFLTYKYTDYCQNQQNIIGFSVLKNNKIIGFMYNGKIINVLLKERGIKAKDLLDHLQLQTNGSISSLVRGNPSAERLEKIADFFDVPIDALFQRSKQYGYHVVGNSNQFANVVIGELRGKTESLEQIIEEKDKRIALLEEMVAMLKNQQKNMDAQ